MIFPIGDDNVKGGSVPFFSYALIGINILIFVFQKSLDPNASFQFLYNFGAIPTEIMAGNDFSSLLTNIFLHGGWLHLLGNMVFLWIFADNIEATIGNSKFIIFYLLGGIVASFSHVLINQGSQIPSIGASGAIAAIMGAYLVMFPKSRIKIFFFFKIIYLSSYIFFGLWIAQNIFSGLKDLDINAADISGTAWWAHIGGFAFGVASGLYFKKMGYLEEVYESTDKV